MSLEKESIQEDAKYEKDNAKEDDKELTSENTKTSITGEQAK